MGVTVSIDIGTTNINVVVEHESTVAMIRKSTITTTINEKKMTQNPKEILSIIEAELYAIGIKSRIENILLSTPMHTLILLDEYFEPISNMMIWSDRRAENAFDALTKDQKDMYYKRTGTPLHSMSPFSKLIINKEEFSYVSDLKAYLMYHLTGRFCTDYSSASASGIWNMFTKNWDEEILSLINTNVNQLPTLHEIDTIFKTKEGSINVIVGSTDGVMANHSLDNEDEIVISMGTSTGVRKLTKKPLVNSGFCYYAGFDQWIVGNASNNGGNVFNWFNEKYLNGTLTFNRFASLVSRTPKSFFCLPFPFGERGPWWVDGLSYKYNELYSAEDNLQTLILCMFANIQIMIDLIDNDRNSITVTGGFFKNRKLLETFGDFIEKDIQYFDSDIAVNVGLLKLINKNISGVVIEKYAHNRNDDLQVYKKDAIDYLRVNISE